MNGGNDFRPIELHHACRLLNHGPTVLVTSPRGGRHGGRVVHAGGVHAASCPCGRQHWLRVRCATGDRARSRLAYVRATEKTWMFTKLQTKMRAPCLSALSSTTCSARRDGKQFSHLYRRHAQSVHQRPPCAPSTAIVSSGDVSDVSFGTPAIAPRCSRIRRLCRIRTKRLLADGVSRSVANHTGVLAPLRISSSSASTGGNVASGRQSSLMDRLVPRRNPTAKRSCI